MTKVEIFIYFNYMKNYLLIFAVPGDLSRFFYLISCCESLLCKDISYWLVIPDPDRIPCTEYHSFFQQGCFGKPGFGKLFRGANLLFLKNRNHWQYAGGCSAAL